MSVSPDSTSQPEAIGDPLDANGPRPDAVPVLPMAAAQAIRFCRACGAPWEPAWLECGRCAGSRPAAAAAVASAELAFRQDQRSIRSAVWLYFALLSVSVITMIALLIAGREATAGEELLAGAAMAAITTGWCIASRGDVLPQLLKPVAIPWFPIAFLAAVPTYAVATAAVMAMNHVFEVEDLSYLDSFMDGGWGFGWAVVGVCVMPGVFEELAFRGVIFGALQRVLGSTEGLLVSALMFAILHLAVPSMPHLFLMGLVLGWLRLRTGSLIPGMLTHFTHNLLVLLAERNGSDLPW